MVKTNLKYVLVKTIIVLGWFIILYNPPIFPINGMHVIGIISIFYLIYNYQWTLKQFSKARILTIYIGFVLILIYLFITVIIINGSNINYIIMPLYYIFDVIPFGLVIACLGNKHCLDIRNYINLAISAGLIQAIISILCFIFPSIHNFCFSLFKNYGYSSTIFYLFEYRMYGLASGLTFAMPVLQMFFAVTLIYRLQSRNIKDLFSILLLIISALINARISIGVLLVGLIIMPFIQRDTLGVRAKKTFFILFVFLVFIVLAIPFIEKFSKSTYDWLVSGVNEIVSFINGNSETIYFSYVTSSEQYHLPATIWQILIGTGHTVIGGNELFGYASDIGYVNDIWLGGIVYCCMVYSLFYKVFNYLKNSINHSLKFLGFLSAIIYPLLNFKGSSFSINSFSIFIISLFIISVTIKKLNKL